MFELTVKILGALAILGALVLLYAAWRGRRRAEDAQSGGVTVQSSGGKGEEK